MTQSNYLASTVENACKFIGIEVELNSEFWQLRRKRLRKAYKYHRTVDAAAPFKLFCDDTEAVNRAEIILLPEELPIFTEALIDHPILLPTSFSQQLLMERDKCCIRLTSQEPFEDFAERLSGALRKLA